jgi:hypothetical protein
MVIPFDVQEFTLAELAGMEFEVDGDKKKLVN